MILSPNDPVSKLHLVDADSEKSLLHLGVRTIQDLLFYFPRDWQDLTQILEIRQIRPNEKISIRARIKKITGYRTPKRRMHLTQALLEDGTGNIVAVWFNQPFLKNQLIVGKEYYFHGKAQLHDTVQLANPTFELARDNTIHTAGIIPDYALSVGITPKLMRYWQKQARVAIPKIIDHLPQELITKYRLPSLPDALEKIHFPGNKEDLAAARERFAFDELLLFQLALISFKRQLKSVPAPPLPLNTQLIKSFVDALPFALTPSQRLAAWEILQDLGKAHPMNRLLEGEVGSGKTVVAGIAMLSAANLGYQSVLLAPTEILAWQHFQTIQSLFKNTSHEISLLTRSKKTGSFTDIESGKNKIIIGTHALLQDSVKFNQIGLLIVDEQHRFGVKQRGQLQDQKKSTEVPHLLSMTATPIPRTLALAFYGDLQISQLRELPRGRKKVITRLVEPEKRTLAYEFIRKEIKNGRQIYVVLPLIEESDKLGTKSAKTEFEKLKKIFPEFSIGLLHGRLRGEEKKSIMHEFKSGKLNILVSTTVIEVGVDVANATVMIIENAERFGLAQLHQLRGRVGRSDLQSYCLLFAESANEHTKDRLSAVVRSNDAFELAEIDLELRGPGEILGQSQSGFIPFKIAKFSDKKLIKLARAEAEALLDRDPKLSGSQLLKQKVAELAKDAHLE